MPTRTRQIITACLLTAGLAVAELNDRFGPQAHGQSSELGSKRGLRYDQYMGGGQMLKAFEPLVAQAHTAVVSIRCDNRIKAFGTVVAQDGYLITKASELSGEIECEFADGRRFAARIVARDQQTDLALLKVQAVDLTPITWSDPEKPARVGQWAITTGNDPLPLAIGVVSVPNRTISNILVLGFFPQDLGDGRGVRVLSVTPELGAAKAGLERDDIITHINDRRIDSREQITQAVLGLGDGTTIRVRINREGTLQELKVKLTATKDPDLRNLQGQRSARDYGFQEVIQHDTHLSPRDCGGPLIDSQGQAIGINIARAGRVASYALPTHLVKPAIQRLFDKQNKLARHPKAKRAKSPNGRPHTKPYLTKALGHTPSTQSVESDAKPLK